MKQVTSFEHACEILGIDPTLLPGVTGLPENIANSIIAGYKLRIIEQATNGDWKADFSDWDQDKYTAWLEYVPSLGAFVCSDSYYTCTVTSLGARFWFATRDAARYFGQQHIELINQLHQ
ncbi:hypothetical protein J3L18_23045 [Mucilaginibacter gossypii]|uniref:hypothetical protein n=1 Tax=Mucilaginibacter gossypii TaxID=551996 RepID=UPI000DCE44EA|nr:MULTISPECIES: hypothetical protein [Mucilaginibacter]QTE35993.1 hypothetical protein J3L18_23045 [Mucilaginibacter gossypii]RAV56666.1 hypothetical protein DIU36_14795 [Mucilaginibacter rubeus]